MKKPMTWLVIFLASIALLACTDSTTSKPTTSLVVGQIHLPVAIGIDSTDGLVQIPFETDGDAAAILWASSDSSIASVDSQGRVTIHGEGLVNIVATSGPHEASTRVIATVDKYVDYVRIRTKAEFLAIFTIPANFNSPEKKYVLETDIDFGGDRIDPIGGWDLSSEETPIDPNRQFRATLDGRGFALKNFEISNSPSTKVGNEYFGVSLIPFMYDGKVVNLNIIDAVFSGTGFTGSIAGKILFGTIENCFIRATITSTARNLGIPSGGIAGIIGPDAIVKNVILDVKVNGGYIYSGFNFGTGSNCNAVSETLDDAERRVPIQNTATSTMKGNEEEDAQLHDFLLSARIEHPQLGDLSQYGLTEEAKSVHWSIAEGTMPYLIRTDGWTPDWAKIEETTQ